MQTVYYGDMDVDLHAAMLDSGRIVSYREQAQPGVRLFALRSSSGNRPTMQWGPGSVGGSGGAHPTLHTHPRATHSPPRDPRDRNRDRDRDRDWGRESDYQTRREGRGAQLSERERERERETQRQRERKQDLRGRGVRSRDRDRDTRDILSPPRAWDGARDRGEEDWEGRGQSKERERQRERGRERASGRQRTDEPLISDDGMEAQEQRWREREGRAEEDEDDDERMADPARQQPASSDTAHPKPVERNMPALGLGISTIALRV